MATDFLNSLGKEKVSQLSDANIMRCYQCGKCSAGCPMVEYMDLMPNQIIRLAQLEKWDEIVEANTIWICAACLMCTVRCPRGINIAEVMEVMRQVVLRDRENDKKLKIAREKAEKIPPIALISTYRKIAE